MRFPSRKLKWCFTCRDSVRIPLNAEERGAVQGTVPYWGANSIQDHVRDFLFDEELVLLGEDGAPFFDPLRDVAFHVNAPIWPNNHVHVLQPKPHIDARYMAYALNSNVDYSLYVGGATRDKLTQASMDNIELPCPPKSAQTAIANYLDAKTAAIDALIAKKELLIEELKKYQETVIAEAVKPRYGWDSYKVKKLFRALPKSSLPSGAGEEVGPVLFYVSGEETKRVAEAMHSGAALLLADGGKATLHFAEGAFSWSDHVVCLTSNEAATTEFVYNQLSVQRALLDALGFRGAGLPMLDKRWLYEDLPVWLPASLEDAVQLNASIRETRASVQRLIANVSATVQELMSYRATLISEAVTGKCKVSG